MRDWLRLVRLPNLATAAADSLAGFLVCSGLRWGEWPPAACWLAVLASLAFYAAGMVLNDVYDLATDRAERPERPLPSGAIAIGRAAAFGNALLTLGAAAACGAAIVTGRPWPAFVGAALTVLVWFYDRHAKRSWLGPAAMGGCRGLNWLLGMTAAGGPVDAPELAIPLGMALYVAGITLYARDEAGRSRAPTLVVATLVMGLGLATAAAYVWRPWVESGQGLMGTQLPVGSWLALWAAISASIILRAVLGILDPTPGRVRMAVGNAIMSIITLDAAVVLAACGERWAIVILALLAVFMAGRRLVPPT